MKLSEAMMLGSVTCKMERGNWEACGLGCAGNALGIAAGDGSNSFGNPRVQAIFQQWPWLRPASVFGNACLETESLPYFGGKIARLFDEEVATGKMSLEQLVDYVRSIEPSCGECNRFDCTCKPEAIIDSDLAVAHI